MDPTSWLYIALLVFFIAMCGFYSATETAFACLSKYKFKAKAEKGERSAKLIIALYEHFDNTLITVLIGNNVFAILISVFSTRLFLSLLSPYLGESVISLIASISLSILVFVFGDTIPKFLGKAIPDKIVKLNLYPMLFFYALFFPLTQFFRLISFLSKKLVRVPDAPEITEEEFTSAIEESEEQGMLEENESDIIQATLDFDDTKVAEVLTPLNKMVMINLDGLNTEKLLDFLKKTDYSRIPVYYKTRSHIVGVLVVKNYLSAYFQDPRISYLSCLQKPVFVSPSVKIDDLVGIFRERHTQIAIVAKSEKVLGMVTMEDVLEELVGEIDEVDEPPRRRVAQ